MQFITKTIRFQQASVFTEKLFGKNPKTHSSET